MREVILVTNAGSSSIKFSLFRLRSKELELQIHGQIDGIFAVPHLTVSDHDGTTIHDRSWTGAAEVGHEWGFERIVEFLRAELKACRILGVGHRVVHGGPSFTQPLRVTREVLAALEQMIPLAPVHQPANLAPIRRALERHPEIPQVACFDTAFHRTIPYHAQLYALPLEFADKGVLRYGFHGLSYEYVASVLPKVDPMAASGKTAVLHLGNGASICALERGRSVANTMGFSSLDGVPMGTRCGSVDPGVLLFLVDGGLDMRQIESLLYQGSGLLGISGISGDMRVLLASEEPRAKLAIDHYVYRIGRELGSIVAALGGLDAVVFTGGIGEHAALIRARICHEAMWTGVRLDIKANAHGGPCISSNQSRVSVWVIPTNEELIIARHTLRLLNEESSGEIALETKV